MSFLAPLFLLGGLAIGLPILFHLIRRTTKERMTFSSLMFLAATPPRLTRRSRFEHILLLLLRCAIICLLALAFARPFLKQFVPQTPASASARRSIVLVDTSASMRRANLWSDAKDKVNALLRDASAADQFAVFTFDRQMKSVLSFDEWNATGIGERAALVRARLQSISPSWNPTTLDNAVIRAAEMLADFEESDTEAARQVIVVTDAQDGSRVTALQSHDWPKDVTVSLERLVPRDTGNTGLQLLTAMKGETGDEMQPVRLRVSNTADSTKEQFEVGWIAGNSDSFIGSPIQVYVPAGQSRVVALPLPAPGAKANRILLKGDVQPFDNGVSVIPPATARVTLLYLGTDSENDPRQPLFFFKHAFPDTPRMEISVKDSKPDALVDPSAVANAALLVVTAPLDERSARLVREAVKSGKLLLFAPTSVSAAASLSALLEIPPIQVAEQKPAQYAMLGEIDFRHPLFAPFADARFSDFTKIHFWRYREIDADALPDARILARFDDGNAALFEVPLGQGRIVVLTSGWHPADSQLALSSKFVPLMQSLLQLSGEVSTPPEQYLVGESLKLPRTVSRPATLQEPDGTRVTLTANETNLSPPAMPGIYSVASGDSLTEFAVNLDPAESRTAPLPADELEQLGVPVPVPVVAAQRVAAEKTRLQNAELESRQKMWRWLIVATLGVLFIETWLAGWTAKRTVVAGGTTS